MISWLVFFYGWRLGTGNCQCLDQTLIISCNWVHFRLVWLSLKMRTEDKNNNFSSPQRQPAALISRYHMVPHSALCICVCVQLFLILLSIFLLLTLALFCSSLSDMLPKVETRVVLVGEAGRNRELAKALQVHRSSVNLTLPLCIY